MILPRTESAAATTAPRLVSLATALPPHRATQPDIKAAATRMFGPALSAIDQRLLGVFDSAGIEQRHFVEPLEWYDQRRGFGEMNAAYLGHALDLAAEALTKALERCGLTPKDLDHLVMVSSTGVATPSLDARLANRLGFRSDFRRTPVWGLGCAGGAAGLARTRDFALAQPDGIVALVALELCSLTFQRLDLDRRNLVAASLFADGAACAIVAGAEASVPRPAFRPVELLGTRSMLWPETLDVMGWDVDDSGFHVVFSRDIPTIVREWVRPNLESFLAEHGLTLGGLQHVVAHPGGPKVLSAYAAALDLDPSAFRHAYEVLRECGNMSSPTCLFVLEKALSAGDWAPGDRAVLAALGPGFSSELVLLRSANA